MPGLKRDRVDPRRALRRFPRVGLLAVAILAFGIGPSTTIFSVIDMLRPRPLPYPVADRIATRPSDPATMAVISALLLVAAVLACGIPARRAANTDSMKAFREE